MAASRQIKLFIFGLIAVVSIFTSTASVLTTTLCLDRSGMQNAAMLPCEPSEEDSTCCDLGWICLSNGLVQM